MSPLAVLDVHKQQAGSAPRLEDNIAEFRAWDADFRATSRSERWPSAWKQNMVEFAARVRCCKGLVLEQIDGGVSVCDEDAVEPQPGQQLGLHLWAGLSNRLDGFWTNLRFKFDANTFKSRWTMGNNRTTVWMRNGNLESTVARLDRRHLRSGTFGQCKAPEWRKERLRGRGQSGCKMFQLHRMVTRSVCVCVCVCVCDCVSACVKSKAQPFTS